VLLGYGGLYSGYGGYGYYKRDTENQPKMIETTTHCNFTSQTNMINCNGITPFQCTVVPTFATNFPFANTHQIIRNLTVIPNDIQATQENTVFSLFSRKGRMSSLGINDYTFMNKGRKFTFSLFTSEHVDTTSNGIRFTDTTCWTNFVQLVSNSMPGNVKMSLIFFPMSETVQMHHVPVTTPETVQMHHVPVTTPVVPVV